MDDLISRSALIERCEVIADCEWNHRAAPVSWADAYETFADMVEDAPAVDAVEVVRCKDCKRWKPVHERIEHMECAIFCGAYGRGYPTDADDFCSYGERRADE